MKIYASILIHLYLPLGVMLAEEKEPDWLENYHSNPSPEKFVDEFLQFGEDGHLSFESDAWVFVGFASVLMKNSPEKIKSWLDALGVAEKRRFPRLMYAALYSGTEEGKAYVNALGIDSELPDLFDLRAETAEELDIFWGAFFASGDIRPIRKIVSAFRFSEHSGAAENFKNSKQTEEDKEAAYLDAVFQSATWSLESNCNQHPLVLEHAETILRDKTLTTDEMTYLAIILSKVAPSRYSVEISDDGPDGSANIKITVPKAPPSEP